MLDLDALDKRLEKALSSIVLKFPGVRLMPDKPEVTIVDGVNQLLDELRKVPPKTHWDDLRARVLRLEKEAADFPIERADKDRLINAQRDHIDAWKLAAKEKDKRIDDLLEANNALLERARGAEGEAIAARRTLIVVEAQRDRLVDVARATAVVFRGYEKHHHEKGDRFKEEHNASCAKVLEDAVKKEAG